MCFFFQLLKLLEKNVYDLDQKLDEAENYSNKWTYVTIENAQDEADNMKVASFRLTNVLVFFFYRL